MPVQYDPLRARAATLLVAQALPNPTPPRVSAVLYLAERTHLEEYGSLMFGGHYQADAHGPRCTAAEGFLSDRAPSELPDLEELSVSNTRALQAALQTCLTLTPDALAARVRDVPWAQGIREGGPITAEHIATTLPNAPELLAYLADPHPD